MPVSMRQSRRENLESDGRATIPFPSIGESAAGEGPREIFPPRAVGQIGADSPAARSAGTL